MEGSFVSERKDGIVVVDEEEVEDDDLGSLSSSSLSDDESASNSVGSSSSEFMEDATTSSSSSSSSLSSLTRPSSGHRIEEGPLCEMSSLIAHLPFKRGLSKHFQGKSQSFTSLANVRSLEDLVKHERPYKKRLMSSKSYGWGLDNSNPLSPKVRSKTITKKGSRGSFSSLGARKNSFIGSRPPIAPQRSAGNLSSETLMFA